MIRSCFGASPKAHGFTRLDLLATTSVLCVLAFLNMAAVSGNRDGNQSATCLANMRELTSAWHQFALDHGHFAPNPNDGNVIPGNNWVAGQSGRGGAHQFNPDILADPSRSLLYPYLLRKDVAVFRCPADSTVGRYQGSDPQKRNSIVPSVRHYAMNGAVGTDPYSPGGELPVHGPWLDNQHAHLRGSTWRTYGKFEDIVAPTPAFLSVLVDEDLESVNDGYLSFGMEIAEWIDWPATRHHMGGTLSYADGHVELRRWVDPRTLIVGRNVARRRVPDSPDYLWLRERMSARIRP